MIYDSGDKFFMEFLQQKILIGWSACFLSMNSFNENPIHWNSQVKNETLSISRPLDVERIYIIPLFCIWFICFPLNLWEACAAGVHNNKQINMFTAQIHHCTELLRHQWLVSECQQGVRFWCQQWKSSKTRARGLIELLFHWCQWQGQWQWCGVSVEVYARVSHPQHSLQSM